MPAKLDFLKDMREHPNTTGGETAARLDVSEGAVLEAYRRSRRQGLLEGDGARPEKFTLTDFGIQQLRVLSGEDNPKPGVAANVEQKLSELQERMSDTVEDVKGLFGLVDRVLAAKRQVPAEPDDLVEELQQENTQLEEQLSQQAKVFEFYAVRIGLAERDGRKRFLQERGNKLAGEVEPETAKAVERLVSLEQELFNEENRFFGPREETVRKLQGEIAALRETLGFVALAASSENKEERDEDGW